jgi:hypothetical protein
VLDVVRPAFQPGDLGCSSGEVDDGVELVGGDADGARFVDDVACARIASWCGQGESRGSWSRSVAVSAASVQRP